MQLKKGQIVEIEIDALAFGGEGIGSFEGLRVFVNDTMPGDLVRASFKKIKKKYSQAQLVEIVRESELRIKPRCSYANVCGGCQMQFIPYEKQLEYKWQHVKDCFERLGGFKNIEVKPVIACEQQFYYRNKMEFSFGYDAEMNFTLGMHVPGRRFDILDLDECHLQSEKSVEIVNKVREFMKASGWPPFKYSCGEGFLKHLIIREGKRTDERMVNLRTSDDLPRDFEEKMLEFVELLKNEATSIYWTKDIAVRGQPRKREEKLLYGKEVLTERMEIGEDVLEFDIHPDAFFQVNTFQAEILYSQVLKYALNREQNMVFDLFCGTGTIGLFLAGHVGNVLGVELNEGAVKVARENAKKNNIFNIDFFVGDVAKVVNNFRAKPSLIVVDPPRAGLTEKLIEKISDFACDQLLYVSCNPGTMARDCQFLSEYGYKIREIHPVDMFPHTYHVECVALLER